jgi:hypothetical protein
MFIPAETETLPLLHVILIFMGAVLVVVSTVVSSSDRELPLQKKPH